MIKLLGKLGMFAGGVLFHYSVEQPVIKPEQRQAPCMPSATAFAIVSVLPVPLQYTTATLLILFFLSLISFFDFPVLQLRQIICSCQAAEYVIKAASRPDFP